MGGGRALLGGRAKTDDGFAGDHGGLVGALRRLEGCCHFGGVVAIDAAHIPVGGGESGELIGRIRHAHFAVNGDAVVVPQHDEVVELQVARQGDGFLGNAFHQAAVAGQHIGLVIDEVIAEAGCQMALGNGKAHGIGKALAQGPGGGFNACGMAIFRVARGLGAQLPEVLEIAPASCPCSPSETAANTSNMEPWPAERMKRSRSGQWGSPASKLRNWVNSTVAKSAAPMGRPGWPELAFWTASMLSARMALAMDLCMSREGAFILGEILEAAIGLLINSSSRPVNRAFPAAYSGKLIY